MNNFTSACSTRENVYANLLSKRIKLKSKFILDY